MTHICKILALLCSLLVAFNAISGEHLPKNQVAESKYVIHKVLRDKSLQKKFDHFFLDLVHGKYDAVEKKYSELIHQTKSNQDAHHLLQLYYAQLLYNKSFYDESKTICDSVLSKTNNNILEIKTLGIKAKNLGALFKLKEEKETIENALYLSNIHKNEYQQSICFYLLGAYYGDIGQYNQSNYFHSKSIALKSKLNDQLGLAAALSAKGLNESHLGNYQNAISFIQKSIEIRENEKDKRGLANSYLSLYKIYSDLGYQEKALKAELKSLAICQEIKDYQCVSGRLTNIGELYLKMGKYTEALNYQREALKISKNVGIENRIAKVHQNSAQIYLRIGDLTKAMQHIDSSIALNAYLKIENELAQSILVKAQIFFETKDLLKAIRLGEEVYQKAEKLQLQTLKMEAAKLLSQCYEYTEKWKASQEYFKTYISLRDSILDIDKTKEINRKEIAFEYKRKQELEQLKQQKIIEKVNSETQRQANLILFGTTLFICVLIFLIIALRLNQQTKKSKRELDTAFSILSEKTNEIVDSINSAKRIQTAMLPNWEEITPYFTDSYIIYKPKDIVAGDFYWFEKVENTILIAVADCTGHGVPGALVSVVCHNALNKAVKEFGLVLPNAILNKTRQIILDEFKKSNEEVKDGMDISLCAFDFTQEKLYWSGAHNPLWILRNGTINEWKADKQPIGFHVAPKPFTLHEIDLKTGDQLFLFTDGFQDQFGGLKGKKYKTANLKHLFENVHSLEMSSQKKQVLSTFEKWKGELEQVDDVCIISVKI